MPMSNRTGSPVEQWTALAKQWRSDFPHVASWSFQVSQFSELRLKYRDDGTVLAIAKGYGEDGGPVVCFGVGYDIILALMALDSTIQGGHWRVDKPWSPKA